MNTRKLGRIFGCMMLLLLPMLGLLYVQTEIPTVYIVISDDYDASVKLASDTIQETLAPAGVKIVEVRLSQFESIPRSPDALVIIGHGQPNGLQVESGHILWSDLYANVALLDAERTVVLACHSPTNLDENIFGFVGQIDAQAGALLSAWHIGQVIEYEMLNFRMQQSIISFQTNMRNPLGKYVCFVHGYFGANWEFDNMRNELWNDLSMQYDDYDYFDYFADYPGILPDAVHYIPNGISTYALNFYNKIISNYNSGDTISIVAHSVGGIITREMLRLKRTIIENAGITIDKVITLGTPHFGTSAAVYPFDELTTIFMLALYGQFWESPVFLSLAPTSPLMMTLSLEIDNYSQGIEWYTIAGVDYAVNAQFMDLFGGDNDGIVSVASAHLPFSTQITIDGISHSNLVNDKSLYRSYGYVDEWLVGPLDSDNDGLSNLEELSIYGSNRYLEDSDFDGINDYDEAKLYYTNPTEPDSDFDGINDYDELNTYGTNPMNADSDSDELTDDEEINFSLTDPLDPDSDDDSVLDGYDDQDNDGLTNVDEIRTYGTNPTESDTDGDTLSDYTEVEVEPYTNPLEVDTDSDGVPDDWEMLHYPYADPTDQYDIDYDGDGLSVLEEYQYGTDPFKVDSDGDSLLDRDEVYTHHTDPANYDSDGDNLSDGYEIHESGTDPNDWDSDDDTLSDGYEESVGSNPMSPDGDSDQMPDVWEVQYIPDLDPLCPDAYYDSDGDGLSNLNEYFYSTNPTESDSDVDTMPDGWEVQYGLNPLSNDAQQDLDQDDLTNLQEYNYGTLPDDSDSDGDTMFDGWEVQYGFNPINENDAQQDADQDGLSNLMEFQYSTNPQDSDSDNDDLSDWDEIHIYLTDPLDSDTDNDSLTDGSEVYTHGTNVLAWSTDADILSDGQEIAWGYDPNDSDDPIEASDLISSAWSKSTLGYVRVNNPSVVDFVKVYVKYKDSSGWWTNYEYKGQINDVHPVYEDYYMYWTIPYGYVQMKVYVKAYDSGSNFIGSDVYYASISSGGGDPPPI